MSEPETAPSREKKSSSPPRWLLVAGAAALGLAAIPLLTRGGVWLALRVPRRFCRPRDSHRIPLEPVDFHALDGVPLRGWLTLPERRPPRAVGVLCHGYLTDHLELVAAARFLREAGYACFLFDFRATGHSGGELCTIGHCEALDVRGALNHLAARPELAGLPRFGLGSSMGAAALTLAARETDEFAALILDCIYPDLEQALERRTRLLWGPLAPLADRAARPALREALGIEPAQVSPQRALRELRQLPTFLIFAGWDIFIPRARARQLCEAAAEPKETWFVPRAFHGWNRYSHPEEYRRRVLAFLDRHLE